MPHAGQAQPAPTACVADSGAQLYVAPSGSDSADGSCNAPWQTIQHAAERATPGSTVNVRGGVYHEIVRVGVSGNQSGAITFRSLPGELAILDGTGLSADPGDSDESDLGLFTLETAVTW